MGWVRWPADAPGNPAILGGKGMALWALLRHGYPVPPAFALPVEACQLWRQAGQPDTLPGAMQTALAEAVARLQALAGGAPRLAVRSSAVAEDSAPVSFAGQLSTQLNVVAEHVAAAVLSVWRSADTTHVAAYRQRLGSEAGGIAVVVQVMVPADAAGVVFTADPLTGALDRLVINAAWGLGEGVVGGMVTPDQWVVERPTGRILESRTGEKTHMVVADDEQGTRLVPTSTDRAARLCLTPQQVAGLTQLALRVEAHLGAPQDIEWAYGNGRFWVLQARPITVQPGAGWVSEFDSDSEPETVWTAANIQEVLPGVLTPLTWSLLREQWRHAYHTVFLDTHTLRDASVELVALFYNRPFLNVSALRGIAARALGTSPEAVDEQYLGIPRDPAQPRAPFTWQRLLAYVDTTPRIVWMLCRTPRAIRTLEARVRSWIASTRQQPLVPLSLAELLGRIQEADAVDREVGALHIATTSGASVAFESLHQLLQHWCGDDASTLLPALTTGLQDMPSAAVGLEMAALAVLIRDPRQDAALQPGEILVAPVTDAGWGPLFLIAAGLVVDVGGPLSHGAIVAREYGLPAVVNVKEAMRLVRTGQTITVNGATGEVWVV